MDIKINYTPHKHQKEIAYLCSPKSPNFTTLVIAGRQSGKSTAALFQAYWWARSTPNQTIFFVSRDDGLSRRMNTKLMRIIGGSGEVRKAVMGKGTASIFFKNGSVIEFKSARSGDAMRGATLDYLIVDEASFIAQDVYTEILLPACKVAKKILICTTPKGKNWIYKMWLDSIKGGSDNIKALKFTTFDNPTPGLERFITELKRDMPDEIYRQEILAEWIDSAAVFKNVEELCCLERKEVDGAINCFGGIDIGMIKDSTIISLIDEHGFQVEESGATGIPFDNLKTMLKDVIDKWHPNRLNLEVNNQGLPMYQELRREGYQMIDEFKTTHESKDHIINELISAFSRKEIKCLKEPELIRELQGFVFEYSPTGKIRYMAASGFHDDRVMALALAWDCYVKNKKFAGSYYFKVGGSDQDVKRETSQNELTGLGFSEGQDFND
jgi:hypothetical protein